jgi:hypothetical protein
MEVPMQTRFPRSWSALRYDLSSQRAVDNASKMQKEHDRLLAEIDALAVRLDAALPAPAPAPSAGEPTAGPGESAQRVA